MQGAVQCAAVFGLNYLMAEENIEITLNVTSHLPKICIFYCGHELVLKDSVILWHSSSLPGWIPCCLAPPSASSNTGVFCSLRKSLLPATPAHSAISPVGHYLWKLFIGFILKEVYGGQQEDIPQDYQNVFNTFYIILKTVCSLPCSRL